MKLKQLYLMKRGLINGRFEYSHFGKGTKRFRWVT